jgi:hypothetical protein
MRSARATWRDLQTKVVVWPRSQRAERIGRPAATACNMTAAEQLEQDGLHLDLGKTLARADARTVTERNHRQALRHRRRRLGSQPAPRIETIGRGPQRPVALNGPRRNDNEAAGADGPFTKAHRGGRFAQQEGNRRIQTQGLLSQRRQLPGGGFSASTATCCWLAASASAFCPSPRRAAAIRRAAVSAPAVRRPVPRAAS